jgi:hypothetical protein
MKSAPRTTATLLPSAQLTPEYCRALVERQIFGKQ